MGSWVGADEHEALSKRCDIEQARAASLRQENAELRRLLGQFFALAMQIPLDLLDQVPWPSSPASGTVGRMLCDVRFSTHVVDAGGPSG